MACLACTAYSENKLIASPSTTYTRGNCTPTSVSQRSFKFNIPKKRTFFAVPSPIITYSWPLGGTWQLKTCSASPVTWSIAPLAHIRIFFNGIIRTAVWTTKTCSNSPWVTKRVVRRCGPILRAENLSLRRLLLLWPPPRHPDSHCCLPTSLLQTAPCCRCC